jgi:hypothetical protein
MQADKRRQRFGQKAIRIPGPEIILGRYRQILKLLKALHGMIRSNLVSVKW